MDNYSDTFTLNSLSEVDCIATYQSDRPSCPVEATLEAIDRRTLEGFDFARVI